MIERIKNKRIVIAGGHQRWQNKIKEILPEVRFISMEGKSLDLSFLDNADALIINTATNSHALYEKIMMVMSKNNVPLYYLNGNLAIERTIEEIHKKIDAGLK